MSRIERNPLHPSALTLQGVTPGREIVVWNRFAGVVDYGWFTGYPYIVEASDLYNRTARLLAVDARSLFYGENASWLLVNIGIVPFPTGWNEYNVTVPAAKVHLLSSHSSLFFPETQRWGIRELVVA